MANDFANKVRLSFVLPSNSIAAKVDFSTKRLTVPKDRKPSTYVRKNKEGGYELVVTYPLEVGLDYITGSEEKEIEINTGEGFFVAPIDSEIYNNSIDSIAVIRKQGKLAILDSDAILTDAIKVEHGS